MRKLPLAARISAGWGQTCIAMLWLIRPICTSSGLRSLYRKLLIRLVQRTALFDRFHYLDNNGDVAALQIRPLFHYIAWGDREGRSPMAFFDPVFYRQHARSRLADVNALLHYAWVGRYRRLSPSTWFDTDYYLSNNKDVARAGLDPLLHFVRWGGSEGRSPSPSFDSAYYLRANRDVAKARLNPLLHYLHFGRLEGRSPLPEQGAGDAPETVRACEPSILPEDWWRGMTPRAHLSHADVDVIVPVYKGRIETLRCLHSVLASKSSVPFELVVINDASPDNELAHDLERLAEQGLITLFGNAENLGFVRTVNRGMVLHPDRDVVLLNSDAEVYDHWLERLRATAGYDPRIGTVTPLSNNATICSYPHFLHDNPFPLEIEYAELDALAACENAAMYVEAPTAVGFCVFIKRTCLAKTGLFDERAFGRGYGEENDFCQRAIAEGWINVIAADVFVHHWGATSFQGEKAALVSNALGVLDKRYPGYQRDVARFIAMDPLAVARRNIDWARLRQMRRKDNVLLVSHGRGGGTERHVQQEIARLARSGYGTFIMRPDAASASHVTLGHPGIKRLPNLSAFELDALDELAVALRELGITAIHAHSFVDMEAQAPARVAALAKAVGARLEVHLHDYTAVCPRVSLADEQGFYCGEPETAGCQRCLAVRDSDFKVNNIVAWRKMYGEVLGAANQIVVPDVDVATRLRRYYPRLVISVTPHEMVHVVSPHARRHPRAGDATRVVVVGAISKLKGFDVLLSCARQARVKRLPLQFVLMGYSMNDALLTEAGVIVTGKYHEQDAQKNLEMLAPDIVWLPSLVPETYSYTLSLPLQSGNPVAAFDIGAIAARLRRSNAKYLLIPVEDARDADHLNDRFVEFAWQQPDKAQDTGIASALS